ncbi:acyltransferase [Actinoplanes sp. NPDC051633]|uniref:acyltransferase family protein n=1 Tax=Actinoplanes sp. NPDC051633 TaxID=3155670 RepID=UPI0034487592
MHRLGWLDALRGWAAATVVVFHLGPWLLGQETHMAVFRFLDFGRYAVLLFFLVSGYVIPMSLERHGSLRRFWIGRVFRIYPAYLAAIAVLILTTAAIPKALTTPLGLIGHATMLTDLFGLRAAVRPFWTLTYEMVFYLAVTALYALRWHRRSALIATLLAVAGAVTSAKTPMLLAVMFAGTVVYRLRQGQMAHVPGGIALVVTFSALTTAVSWPTAVAVAATFTAFFAMRERRMPAVLTGLGTISYSLYVLHVVVMLAYARLIPRLTERPAEIRLVAAAACLATAVGAAVLAYRWIESPAQALGRRLGRRLATQRAAPRTARRENATGSV